jgi:hypothetical protein
VVDCLNDQRENDRRERETTRISNLPADQCDAAITAEASRQRLYDKNRRGPTPSTSEDLSILAPLESPSSPIGSQQELPSINSLISDSALITSQLPYHTSISGPGDEVYLQQLDYTQSLPPDQIESVQIGSPPPDQPLK